MVIQKTIVITYIVQDVREDAFIFDEVWRVKRGSKSYKGFECFNCGREFKNNERFGFIVTDKGNKTVCNKCAKEIKENLDKERRERQEKEQARQMQKFAELCKEG